MRFRFMADIPGEAWFQNPEIARKQIERGAWPNGPVCFHCRAVGRATLMKGKSTRAGLYQCNACRRPFTVTMGTIYERSKIPLSKWLAATYLMELSGGKISALEVGRKIGVSKKTAWYICKRIRDAIAGISGKRVVCFTLRDHQHSWRRIKRTDPLRQSGAPTTM
jgi:transposase-like protein